MKNGKCIVCGKEFEPRVGKKYCSENCKSSHYYETKKNISTITQDENEVQTADFKTRILYRFDYSEFLKVSQRIKGLDFMEYCYIRSGLTGKWDFEQLIEFIESWDSDFSLNSNLHNQPYLEFVKSFQKNALVYTTENKKKSENITEITSENTKDSDYDSTEMP